MKQLKDLALNQTFVTSHNGLLHLYVRGEYDEKSHCYICYQVIEGKKDNVPCYAYEGVSVHEGAMFKPYDPDPRKLVSVFRKYVDVLKDINPYDEDYSENDGDVYKDVKSLFYSDPYEVINQLVDYINKEA